jgi:hypothetical protein
MSQQVVLGAQLQCSFGASPGKLVVLPVNRVMVDNKPAATIMDHVPIVNIATFGMCNSPSNPAFIAATAAAMGTPTPVPCVPVTSAPWMVGAPTVLIGGMPALNNTSKCMCLWAGVISITDAGQTKTNIP